jgi:hypothetical protein
MMLSAALRVITAVDAETSEQLFSTMAWIAQINHYIMVRIDHSNVFTVDYSLLSALHLKWLVT